MKIITVTLNPAIDKTVELERLLPEELNKVMAMRHDVGGKGINVSRVLKSLGSDSLAMGFVAGNAGQFILHGLEALDVQHDFITVSGETRTNLKIFDRSNAQITEINEPGPEVSEVDFDQLMDKLMAHLTSDTLVVLSGSIPRTLNPDVYLRVLKGVKSKGAQVFLDADGEPFKTAVEAIPHLIKPNKDELERYFGKTLKDDQDVIEAMRYFVHKGIEHVFVTMGKEGSYYGSHAGYYKMHPLKVNAHSSVGAGDAFVGAVCHARSQKYEDEFMLKLAVATSAGAVTTIGTNPASIQWIDAHIDDVKIEKIGGDLR